MSDTEKNCNSCKLGLFGNCDTLKKNEEYQEIWKKAEIEKRFSGTLEAHKFKNNFICEQYKSCYIEYPITVSKINTDSEIYTLGKDRIGKFAKIRPCGEEYGSKTYLGLFLGELPIGIHITHNPETLELNASYSCNPAIFVFDLNKIVYGCESWWSVIENEGDLKQITDIDINNVWYVRALNALHQADKETDSE